VRAMGRQAGGVNGMDLASSDFVVSMDAVRVDFEIILKEFKKETQNLDELESDEIRESLTSLCSPWRRKVTGSARRWPSTALPRAGVRRDQPEIHRPQRPVVAALQVREESDVMIITSQGKVIRVHSGEIREAGRSTQGVRLLRLDEGDRVVAAAAVLEEEVAVSESEKK